MEWNDRRAWIFQMSAKTISDIYARFQLIPHINGGGRQAFPNYLLFEVRMEPGYCGRSIPACLRRDRWALKRTNLRDVRLFVYSCLETSRDTEDDSIGFAGFDGERTSRPMAPQQWEQAVWHSLEHLSPVDTFCVLDVRFLYQQYKKSGLCHKYSVKDTFYTQLVKIFGDEVDAKYYYGGGAAGFGKGRRDYIKIEADNHDAAMQKLRAGFAVHMTTPVDDCFPPICANA